MDIYHIYSNKHSLSNERTPTPIFVGEKSGQILAKSV